MDIKVYIDVLLNVYVHLSVSRDCSFYIIHYSSGGLYYKTASFSSLIWSENGRESLALVVMRGNL